MKFEENWPGVSEEKSFNGVDGWWTKDDDGWQVITIAHPDHSAGKLKRDKSNGKKKKKKKMGQLIFHLNSIKNFKIRSLTVLDYIQSVMNRAQLFKANDVVS